MAEFKNYEPTGAGKFRCFIDNKEYKTTSDIPAYGNWSVKETYDDLGVKTYWNGEDSEISKLPTDMTKCPFLKRGCDAITRAGSLYTFNSNTCEWKAFKD